MIAERERYMDIGDDLDFAFVELIPGVEICYNDRHPKPPTPEPTPAELRARAAALAADDEGGFDLGGDDSIEGEEATEVELTPEQTAENLAADEATAAAELAALEPVVVVKEETPEPEPRPFDLLEDLPPEGAEVPFVRNYEPPAPQPEVVEGEVPADGAPPAEGATPVDGAPAVEGAPPADGAAPAPAEGAPAADAAAAPPAAEPAPAAP